MPSGQYLRLGSTGEDLECFLVHSLVINYNNIFFVAHLVTFFWMTKYDNTAKCQNSKYNGKFYIIFLIL